MIVADDYQVSGNSIIYARCIISCDVIVQRYTSRKQHYVSEVPYLL